MSGSGINSCARGCTGSNAAGAHLTARTAPRASFRARARGDWRGRSFWVGCPVSGHEHHVV